MNLPTKDFAGKVQLTLHFILLLLFVYITDLGISPHEIIVLSLHLVGSVLVDFLLVL